MTAPALPHTYTDRNETGCCAVPDVESWRDTIVTFDRVPFIRAHTRSLFFMPLNMAKVMTELATTGLALAKNPETALDPRDALILSRDLSPFRAEHLYRVTQPILGADNLELSGEFASIVREGPYKKMGEWMRELRARVTEMNRTSSQTYAFYTTCPNCAKHYGKNYVVLLAKLEPPASTP